MVVDTLNSIDVLQSYFYSAILVGSPSVESLYMTDIAKDEYLVILRQIGLINPRNGKFPGTYVFLHKIAVNGITYVQMQLISDITGYKYFISGRFPGKLRHTAVCEVLFKKLSRIFGCNSFQGNTEEIGIGFQNSRFCSKQGVIVDLRELRQ